MTQPNGLTDGRDDRVGTAYRPRMPKGEGERLRTLALYALPRADRRSARAARPERPLGPHARRTLVKMVETFPNWKEEFAAALAAVSAPPVAEAVRIILADIRTVEREPQVELPPEAQPEGLPSYELAAEYGLLNPSPGTVEAFKKLSGDPGDGRAQPH
jgi:hypothetical protein